MNDEDLKNLKNLLFEKTGSVFKNDDPALMIYYIHSELTKDLCAAIDNTKPIKDGLESVLHEYRIVLNETQSDINKLGSTSNTIVAATSEMLKDVERLSSETKQSVIFTIQRLQAYMKGELPNLIRGIDHAPISKKIQDELVQTITLDTQKIKEAAAAQSNITSELMKLGQNISMSAAKAKQASEAMTEYSQKQTKTILYVVGGSAFIIGLLLGGILIKSIG